MVRPKEGCTWYGPHGAPPEVRCLTPEVPARRGWGVSLTEVASAVSGIELARCGGLLVSRPGSGSGSGPGSGWSRDLGPPVEGSGVGAPPQPGSRLVSCPSTSGARAAALQRLGPACDSRSFWPSQVRGRPGSLSLPPLHRGDRPFLRCPPVDPAPGVGGRQGSRLTYPPAPAGRVSQLPTLAELSPSLSRARLRPPAPSFS